MFNGGSVKPPGKNRSGSLPLRPEQLDSNFLALDTAVCAIEAQARAVAGLGDLVVSDDGPSITMPLTDVTDKVPRNLPLGRFGPVGPWETGTAYLERDLVSQGRESYVALADHQASVFDDDLAAGRWLLVTNGAAGRVNARGVYDPTVAHAEGDAVLVTPDGGVTFVQTAARTDLPAGTALDHVDSSGQPLMGGGEPAAANGRARLREDLAPRHVGGPLVIPVGMAGSVARLDTGAIRTLTISLYAQASAPSSAPRLLKAFDFAAGATVTTRSGPGGLLASSDTVTVLANGSARPFVIELAMALVGVHV